MRRQEGQSCFRALAAPDKDTFRHVLRMEPRAWLRTPEPLRLARLQQLRHLSGRLQHALPHLPQLATGLACRHPARAFARRHGILHRSPPPLAGRGGRDRGGSDHGRGLRRPAPRPAPFRPAREGGQQRPAPRRGGTLAARRPGRRLFHRRQGTLRPLPAPVRRHHQPGRGPRRAFARLRAGKGAARRVHVPPHPRSRAFRCRRGSGPPPASRRFRTEDTGLRAPPEEACRSRF